MGVVAIWRHTGERSGSRLVYMYFPSRCTTCVLFTFSFNLLRGFTSRKRAHPCEFFKTLMKNESHFCFFQLWLIGGSFFLSYFSSLSAHVFYLPPSSSSSSSSAWQLNDGYTRLGAEDGLMFGSVHPGLALELIVWLVKGKFAGHVYFDTFPRNEDPVRECEANINTCKRMWAKAVSLLEDPRLPKCWAAHDGLSALQLLGLIENE
mmetsp:Transcript_64903/g.130475  ORF Transcript_64903/g.130475 Transcript_64903/m.130475 type:complete len:206 (+) Transcript_64903:41-658(+)